MRSIHLSLLGCLYILSGCMALKPIPICEEVTGLEHSLGEGRTVSLLIVHGIGGYSEGDPDSLICGLVDELGLCPTGTGCLRRVYGGTPSQPMGWVQRDDYTDPYCGTNIRIYTVDWREATWREKALLRELERASCTEDRMVPMLYEGRTGFVNSGLADIALYLGNFGRTIRYPLQQALRWVNEDAIGVPNHHLVLVSYSMGCHLLLAALDDLCEGDLDASAEPSCQTVRRQLIEDLSAFFMLSSELPLLYFAEIDPPAKNYVFHDSVGCEFCAHCYSSAELDEPKESPKWHWDRTSLGRLILDKRALDPDFQIVVINDPNDLLSYTVEDVFLPEGARKDVFANIGVRNVKYSLFGYYADPIQAHEGYGKNPNVIRILAHGTCPEKCQCRRCR
ncbi:MAG: hypothetical protein KDK78_03175 [Chlamydiia bacterium]|nr:hypothetical protein [Chlamydiia bacterium]